MNAFKTSISALALVALAAGGIGAATLMPANAQPAQTAPAGDKGMHHGHHHRFDAAARARFLEGRIAFMKTVLQITPAQEPAFNGVADAMRANAKDRATAWGQFKANRDKPKTAVDRLEMRIQVTKMRTAGQERLLTAFKPLYASMSPEQQKLVNNFLAGHHGHRGHHAPHRG